MDIEEFWGLIWSETDGISSSIVSDSYLADENNRDYLNEVVYELYRLYEKDNSINIKVLSKSLEIYISLSRKFHIPHLKLITDAGN